MLTVTETTTGGPMSVMGPNSLSIMIAAGILVLCLIVWVLYSSFRRYTLDESSVPLASNRSANAVARQVRLRGSAAILTRGERNAAQSEATEKWIRVAPDPFGRHENQSP